MTLPTNQSLPLRRAMVMYLGGTPLRTRVSSQLAGTALRKSSLLLPVVGAGEIRDHLHFAFEDHK